MNNAGAMDSRLIVILNDNDMSIAPPVGAMSAYLARLISGETYRQLRNWAKQLAKILPKAWERRAARAEEYTRGFWTGGTLFEELGFYYVGPIDGHNFDHLLPVLRNVRDTQNGPILIHVVTQKGKGYEPAEISADKFHGVNRFNVITGAQEAASGGAPSYTKVFANALIEEAKADEKIVAITAAMPSGTGLDRFAEAFPDRTFDVGIAEQHAVTFAAGLAVEGFKPFAAIYSTFLQRAYDQLIHDVALQNLPVVFAVDRAGLVGSDGATHQGSYDLSFLRCIPNMVIMAPADENECRQMLYTGTTLSSPSVVRYPRGTGPGAAIAAEMTALPVGQAQLRREGRSGLAILAFGALVDSAQKIAERLDATLVNMRFVKPLDEKMVVAIAERHQAIITIEENAIMGGAGAGVGELLAAAAIQLPLLHIGIPDKFIEHGTRDTCLGRAGLDLAGLSAQVERWWAQHSKSTMRSVSGA
jgi:1-deoxy-D-xylulose-5-phosphate synthase